MKLLSIIKNIIWVTALVVCTQAAMAQDIINVSGKVTDNHKEPLIGASVVIVGSNKGVITNTEGQYSIKAKVGDLLRFSFIGMKTITIKVTSNNINVVLEDNEHALDGVVFTGYQKIKNRVFTGASQSVKMKDVKLDGVPDVSHMLQGRVAGLSIQNITGSFGAAPRINIRGGASILGNVQPLWVIDGAVHDDLVTLTLDDLASGDPVTLIGSAVSGLNPSDIEDIQVLKDASATSIYGTRALNGVIVITTKSGKKNAPNTVNYAYELGIRAIPSYSEFDLLNSQETMSIYQEMDRKGYFSFTNTRYGRRGGVFYQMNKALSTIDPKTGTYYLTNNNSSKVDFLKEKEYANTDWFKELFTYKPIQTHTITFSGGGANSAMYASVGYYQDSGWTITDNVKRITANLKETFYWNEDKIKVTLAAQGNIRQQKSPGTIPQKKNTVIGSFERDFDINPFSYALGTSRTLKPRNKYGELEYYRNNWAEFNILNEYKNNYLKTEVLDYKFYVDLSYKPINDLELKALTSVRSAHTNSIHTITEQSNIIGAYKANKPNFVALENIYLYKDIDHADKLPSIALKEGGILNKVETSLNSYIGRLSADYNKQIGKSDVRAFAFAEVRYADRRINPFQGFGIQYDKGNQVYTDPLIFRKLANEGSTYFSLNNRYERGVSLSVSGTYGYNGKYIINGVVNYEGSNASGAFSRTRWLPTWNIGGKWNIDAEAFMKNHKNISQLALRASYGLTAKMNEQAINSNTVYKYHIINRYNSDNRENALDILHLENRDLTWEQMYELNIGLDLGLFDSRIAANIDVYKRNSFDLIDLVENSGVGGEPYKYANFGNMSALGAELALQTKNIVKQNFTWTTSFTFSAINQKITKLLNAPNTFDMVAGTGRGSIINFPRGALFSFNFQGLDNNGLPTFDFGLYPSNQTAITKNAGADFLDSRYSKTYLIYNGPIEPVYMCGMSNMFRWKNWDFSFFITANGGNKIRINPTFDPNFGDLNVFANEYYDRWLNPGDEFKTTVPVIPSQDLIRTVGRENIERAFNTYNYSQQRVADGSFVRVKNIAIGYTLPQKYTSKIKLSRVNIRANATNPFLIYADPTLHGQDPEFYKSGGVALPTPKQLTMTLNIEF